MIACAGVETIGRCLPPESGKFCTLFYKFLRDNWLSNRIFLNEDDLVDHCCETWNKLEAQPWRIMSIGMREWAHRF